MQADFFVKEITKTVPLISSMAVTNKKVQGMIVVEMSPQKGHYMNGQVYAVFSHVTRYEKLHIVNHTRDQKKTSNKVESQRTSYQTFQIYA